jgi:signal recognition particle subunit SEC65
MIIYPSNIDLNLSKKEGRKISKKHAVHSPKTKEIVKALEVLNVKGVKPDKEACYPKKSWECEGRVNFEVKGGKLTMMRKVSKEIKRRRTHS